MYQEKNKEKKTCIEGEQNNDEAKWETDEEILQEDCPAPYEQGSYGMRKWAGYGFPECYLVGGSPETFARRRRIYDDYVNGLRPRSDAPESSKQASHQITLKKYVEKEKEEGSGVD